MPTTDGRGWALDDIFVERLWRNLKYEDVHLESYANMAELTVGLAQYLRSTTPSAHIQVLTCDTADQVYRVGFGRGAGRHKCRDAERKHEQDSIAAQRLQLLM